LPSSLQNMPSLKDTLWVIADKLWVSPHLRVELFYEQPVVDPQK
jgi:hypothetical protein